MVARRQPLNGHAAPDPVRVFVGTSAGDDAEACLTLEYSLRKNSSAPVELTWLAPSDNPKSPLHGWNTQGWATPWTGYRWIVPLLARKRGRAVYMDCPQVVVGDVARLAKTEFPEGTVVLTRRSAGNLLTGVMVWECELAYRVIPDLARLRGIGSHQERTIDLFDSPFVAELPAGWDIRDVEFSTDPGIATGSLHFATTALQPHVALARRRLHAEGREHWFQGTRLPHFSPGMVEIFEREYAAAIDDGYAVQAYAGPEQVELRA